MDDIPAFRDALREADFDSVRGKFAFGANQHPIQDWFALRVEAGDDGTPVIRTIGTVFTDHVDAYAADCQM